MIATDVVIDEALREILLLVESNCPGSRCGALLLCDDGIHVARALGPNLPESYNAALKGLAIGPLAGSCGAAMHHKRSIFVADVDHDPLRHDYRHLAIENRMEPCWATPILTSQGTVLGALSMHYSEVCRPNVAEERFAELAARLASATIERDRTEELLRASEERCRLMALATRDAIYDWDLRRDVFWPNESFRKLYLPDSPVSLTYEWWRDRIHPQDQARVARGLEEAIRGQHRFWSDEYLFRRPDGTSAVVLDRGYFLHDSQGETIRMIGAMTDITARRKSEDELRASEERYRNIVETQTEMICRCLPDATLTFVNDACCRQLGRTREELIGKSFLNLLPKAEQPRVQKLINEVLRHQQSGPTEHIAIQRDENLRWTLWSGHVLRDGNGGIELQAIGRDVTEQKRAEQALQQSQEKLRRSHSQVRRLAGFLMKGQEEERRHLARELHDHLNQQVAGLSISLSKIKRHLPPSADFLAPHLEQLQARAVGIANDIRNLSHELHPAVLEHAGLSAALRSLVAEFSNSQAVSLDLSVPEDLMPLPSEISICLYRIAQESLRNIIRHSGANYAKLDISVREGYINLVITDNGSGFEMESARNKGGLGLISMAERVDLLQGVIELKSTPGDGTSLRIVVPLNRTSGL